MQSRSYLFLAVVVVLTALSGYMFTQRKFAMGLDVQGGVRLTYVMDTEKLAAGTSLSGVQEQVAKTLGDRASGSLGVAEPIIQKKGEKELIVELPGATDIAKAQELLGTTAKIEWYHATNLVTSQVNYRPYDTTEGDGKLPIVWFIKKSDPTGKPIKPEDPEYAQIIKGWGKPIIEGTELLDAEPQANPGGDGYSMSMRFNNEGARKMEAWCRINTYREEKLAAVLDGRVLSVNPLEKGSIIKDQGQIRANYTPEYVNTLSGLLRSGALPVTLKETSSSVVDPTVGKFALQQILTAGFAACALIAVFMLGYYVFPGFIALLALGLYILFTLTVLKWANATFSLAAIAGFVLSVGMAVDANILVFERVKEEMRNGRPLMKAIELGFSRALPAIIDSNACTLLTSLVLANLGTGPVKGFAITLIIGVLISLFTAIVVTRSLLVFFVGSGIGANPKWYGMNRGWFGSRFEDEAHTKPLKIVERSKLYFIISAATIVPGIIFFAMGGIKKNVEFTGGYEGSYLAPAVTQQQISDNLDKAGIKGYQIKFQTAGDKRIVDITVPEAQSLGSNQEELRQKLATVAGFKIEDQVGFSTISSTIRDETIRNAILGVVLSSALIIIWLALRFGFALGGFVVGLRFAVSVILALVHDILVVVGLAAIGGALAGWEISALFISAMLTVIGFSTHDTIVIFDRIRENLRRPQAGEDLATLMNRSITQSFARSLNTSGTVIVTLLLLTVMGSATVDLKLFNAAMLIGVVSGTYSSIFNAAPILYLWDRAISKKGEGHGLMGMARQAASAVRLQQPAAATVTPAAQVATPSAGAAGYGQTKRRRASEAQKGVQELDD